MAQLSDQDIASIVELHDRWIKEELAGNSAQIITFCTDDVKWIPPNSYPLQDKQAIVQYLENDRIELKDVRVTDLAIGGSDEIAYLTSNFSSRYISQHSAEVHESTGTHLWILRKTANVWQVAVVAWSLW